MIIFAVAEVGSAKNLINIIKSVGREYVCFVSELVKPIFENENISTLTDFRMIADVPADLIVTALGWSEGVDKNALWYSHQHGIPCIAIVEHWTWFRHRFTINNQLVVPDHTIVNDDLAVQEAVICGLPAEKIFALGNTVLESYGESSTYVPNRAAWCRKENLPLDKKIITFVSEEFAKDFPKGSDFYQGFTEFDVIEDILSVMESGMHLIIKMHPSEDSTKFNRYARRENISVINKTQSMELILNSDFFIGMGSMFLMEAAFLRDDIISYRPNQQMEFIGNKMGVSRLCQRKEELADLFQSRNKIHNTFLKEQFSGSTSRIVNFIQRKTQGILENVS